MLLPPPPPPLACRFEVGRGQLAAARRVFLRAVREAAWCKPLWMQGLRLLGQVGVAVAVVVVVAVGWGVSHCGCRG